MGSIDYQSVNDRFTKHDSTASIHAFLAWAGNRLHFSVQYNKDFQFDTGLSHSMVTPSAASSNNWSIDHTIGRQSMIVKSKQNQQKDVGYI